MCGHVGIIKTGKKGKGLSLNERKLFEQMLFVDQLRGKDGTGVARIDGDSTVQIIKAPLSSNYLIDSKAYSKVDYYPNNIQALIGHNRKSTIGKDNYSNTHPFQIGDIVLAHNGTILNEHSLSSNDTSKYGTDSECIAEAINSQGIEETVKSINGAFALVWHDSTDNSINFIRNEERDFYFTFLEDNGLVYASEVGLISWLCYRNKVNYKEIFKTAIGYEYKILLDMEETSFIKTKYDLYEKPPYSGQYSHNSRSNYNYGTHWKESNNYKGNNINKNSGLSSETKKERKKRKKKLIEDLGLKVGEEVVGSAWGFTPYENNKHGLGTMHLSMIEEPYLAIDIPRINQCYYNRGDYYTITIQTIKEPVKDDPDYEFGSTLISTSWARVYLKDEQEEYKKKEKKLKGGKAKTQSKDTFRKRNGPSYTSKGTGSNNMDKLINKACNILPLPLLPRSNEEVIEEDDREEWEKESYLLGPRNIMVPIKEWKNLTKYGCSWCQGHLSEAYHEDILWVDSNTPLCQVCADDYTDPRDDRDPQDPNKMLN